MNGKEKPTKESTARPGQGRRSLKGSPSAVKAAVENAVRAIAQELEGVPAGRRAIFLRMITASLIDLIDSTLSATDGSLAGVSIPTKK